MNLANLVLRNARVHGDRPALYHGDAPVCDWATLAGQVAALAGALTERFGLRPGDRVGLFMANTPQYLALKYAAWWAGMTALPINAKLHERELAYILDNAGARICFVTADLADKGAAAAALVDRVEHVVVADSAEFAALSSGDGAPLADVAPADIAWLFYTSGTTGQPKGAMLSHRNLLAMTMTYFVDVDDVPPDGHCIHAAPISHGSGCYGLPFLARGAAQVIPVSGGFEPGELYALIDALPEVVFFAAPTMIKRLVEYDGGGAAANLRTITYGGGPMYVADCLRAMDRLGPKLIQLYGQGESPMTITALSRADHMADDHPLFAERLASVGVAQSCVEVRVADDDDATLPTGEVGEVLVRGDVVMAGYWDNAEASAATLRGGWLHTGDMGAFDADGYLTLKDRSKDVIISGGTNIYPREIEEVLLRHADVGECAVVGRPHAEWGEEVVAFVAPPPGRAVDTGELDRLCLDNIARFKRPRDYRVTEALPKNNYGKILKTELRNWLAAEDQ